MTRHVEPVALSILACTGDGSFEEKVSNRRGPRRGDTRILKAGRGEAPRIAGIDFALENLNRPNWDADDYV